MRLVIGLLVLGSLFLMAASWQERLTDDLREERRARHGVPIAEEVRRGERWSRLVLGRPSGTDALVAPGAPAPGVPAVAPADELHPTPTPEYVPDATHQVAPGQVLGTICQGHYPSGQIALQRIVDAVADYNDLPSADAIRQGQVLLLPELGVLFPDE